MWIFNLPHPPPSKPLNLAHFPLSQTCSPPSPPKNWGFPERFFSKLQKLRKVPAPAPNFFKFWGLGKIWGPGQETFSKKLLLYKNIKSIV